MLKLLANERCVEQGGHHHGMHPHGLVCFLFYFPNWKSMLTSLIMLCYVILLHHLGTIIQISPKLSIYWIVFFFFFSFLNFFFLKIDFLKN